MRVRTAVLSCLAAAAVIGTAGVACADSGAAGAAVDSPGVISGNDLGVPIHMPIDLCGNNINVAAVGNSASGTACVNG